MGILWVNPTVYYNLVYKCLVIHLTELSLIVFNGTDVISHEP